MWLCEKISQTKRASLRTLGLRNKIPFPFQSSSSDLIGDEIHLDMLVFVNMTRPVGTKVSCPAKLMFYLGVQQLLIHVESILWQ